MSDNPENVKRFRKLLPRGSQREIARRLNITEAAVSEALNKLDPRNAAVQEAVRIAHAAQKGAAGETQKLLVELLNIPGPSMATAE